MKTQEAAPLSATDGGGKGKGKGSWYLRKGFLVPAVVVVVLAVVVVTDLPQSPSRAAQISNDTIVMQEVNADIGPCSYALAESFTIYKDLAARTLSRAERDQVPTLLTDDQTACSFTSQSIYDLSTIVVPGSASGKDLGQLVGIVTLWATSDALAAIEQIQTFDSNPSGGGVARNLGAEDKMLAHDRAAAEAELAAVDGVVREHLPALVLAQAPEPGPQRPQR